MADTLAECLVLLSISDPPRLFEGELPPKFHTVKHLLDAEYVVQQATTYPEGSKVPDRLALFCHGTRGLQVVTERPPAGFHTFIAYMGTVEKEVAQTSSEPPKRSRTPKSIARRRGTPEREGRQGHKSVRRVKAGMQQFFYGFCYSVYFPVRSSTRRGLQAMLPSGERLPRALFEPHHFVIVSRWPYHATFAQLMKSAMSIYSSDSVLTSAVEAADRLYALMANRYPPTTIGCGTRVSFVVPAPGEFPIADLNYCPLIQRFPIHVIITILSAILNEHRLMFYGSNLAEIAPFVESFRSLMAPFQWQYLYIPYLPHAYADVCMTESPFIVGVLRETCMSFSEFSGPVIFVDVDNGKLSGDMLDSIPSFPPSLSSKLLASLQSLQALVREPKFMPYSSVYAVNHIGSPSKAMQCLSETSSLSVDEFDPQGGDVDIFGEEGRGRVISPRAGIWRCRTRRAYSCPPSMVTVKEAIPRLTEMHVHCRALTTSSLQLGAARAASNIALVAKSDQMQTQTQSCWTATESTKATEKSLGGQIGHQLRHAAMQLFLELFEWYRMYLLEDDPWFRTEAFIDSLRPECKCFMTGFASSRMFEQFVYKRAHRVVDCFERELNDKLQRAVSEAARPRFEGYLFKRGHIVPSWKWRYFVIGADSVVSYYKGDGGGTLKGTFSLVAGDTTVRVPQLSVQSRYPTAYPFELCSPSRSLLMCAPDNQARQEWLSVLRAHIRVLNLKKTLKESVHLRRPSFSPITKHELPVPCASSHDHYGNVMYSVDLQRANELS